MNLTREQLQSLPPDKIKRLGELIKQKQVIEARDSLLTFTERMMPLFKAADFHKVYYEILDMFAKGDILNLIITIPPQHGKSTGSTMYLIAFLFGLFPDLKIAISSYSTPITQRFNRAIQRIMDTPEYREIFPNIHLGDSNVVTVTNNALRNASEFEIMDSNGKIRGKLMSVGRGGALTSQTVDVWIGDDLYKDYAEGNSPVVRDAVWEWFVSVPLSRQPKQKLKVFTRWHEDDSIGRIEAKEKVVTANSMDDIHNAIQEFGEDVWIKINFEAIKSSEKTEFDQREKGEALWEEMRPLRNLEKIRALDPEQFNCLYQGNPISAEGLLYSRFKTYNSLPSGIKKNKTDTADKGSDYLCSICYVEDSQEYCYVTDILYTQAAMEITEPGTADMLIRNDTRECDIESNNGGRGFARKVDELTPSKINITWHHQSDNKESRIFSNSATVSKMILFPENWHSKWPEFYDHVTKYKKIFKANKYDDAPDVLTSIVEEDNKPIAQIIW